MSHSPSITLHQFPRYRELESVSGPCIKIQRLLQYKRLAYAVEERGSTSIVRRLRIHGSGKLPVLAYDGELVADSARIARFLEERHPEPPALPKDPKQRALCDLLEDWADESLYLYLGWYTMREYSPDLAATYFPSWPRALDPLLRLYQRGLIGLVLWVHGIGRYPPAEMEAQIEALLDALGERIGDGFAVCEHPTTADFAIYGSLRRLTTGATPRARSAILGRVALAAWLERIDAAAGIRAAPAGG